MLKDKTPFIIWFTGYSASGKTTLAEKLLKKIQLYTSLSVYHLDGDSFRSDFPIKFGFTKDERVLNIKSAAFIAQMLSKNNICVLASFITPYNVMHDYLRKILPNYIEIFLDAPLKICLERDYKGNYKRAMNGELLNFTGVSDPYERPISPELIIKTAELNIDEALEKIWYYLIDNHYI